MSKTRKRPSTNIPKKYVPQTLSRKNQAIQKKEVLKSRKYYKKGQYHTRRKLKGVAKKRSSHIKNAFDIYKINSIAPSPELSKATGCSLKVLELIQKKGQGAYYSSGSRPNQTAHSWGNARLASSVTGGKSSVVDYSLLVEGCNKNSIALKLSRKAMKKHGRRLRRTAKISN